MPFSAVPTDTPPLGMRHDAEAGSRQRNFPSPNLLAKRVLFAALIVAALGGCAGFRGATSSDQVDFGGNGQSHGHP